MLFRTGYSILKLETVSHRGVGDCLMNSLNSVKNWIMLKKDPFYFWPKLPTILDDRAWRALSVVQVWACSIVAASYTPNRHFAQFCKKMYELPVRRSSGVIHLLDEKFWNFGFYSGKTRSSCLETSASGNFLVTKWKNEFFFKER
jgi:hypothetical protein